MKKLILSMVLISGLTVFGSCNLISSAGYNSKGLPASEFQGEISDVQDPKIDHSLWTELLRKHVDDKGRVDYKGFQQDREKLDEYLKMLSSQNPSESWSKAELLAYYINLYNAYTVDLILKNYPVESIKDIHAPWTKAFIKVGDTKISLGGIENSLLRKMNEPRIHFAINCASISCPNLRNEAYTAKKIDQQLEEAAKEFINSDKNEISEDSAKLSRIFDWYEGDFTGDGKTIVEYINKYSNTKLKPNAWIKYKDYNWNLNDVK
ncbi:DUF547 domain-containing protein [Christiangramia fulva]|uniref:DUF547 domain-containing protein n=1 Tax=Christiangramia fulva TaxID=2126553 RepID=A0A2R3ZAJ6_9FLAO|nr:DUF547 domain-containing protein [Christiangramia fulva]AVR47318.1 DUF547 domain-containing protein [Christiangramia fulva]